MAEASTARAAIFIWDLPDEIFISEILLRLPPKAILRCRATSARDFLLAHHARQPSLPILFQIVNTDDGDESLNIMHLDHSAGVAATDKIQSVARVASHDSFMHIDASCDGLLIVCTVDGYPYFSDDRCFSVCNPATRQYAPLPRLHGFCIAGMYPHPPTDEYRLLLYPDTDDQLPPAAGYDCFVYALGSCEPPRAIGWPGVDYLFQALHPVLFRGDLHWFAHKDESQSQSCTIVVFDTIAELFRQMRAPAIPGAADLFEMDGVLAMASFSNGVKTIDIWMARDYDSEVWAFKCRVEMPIPELTMRFGYDKYTNLMISFWDDDDVFILVESDEWLFQIDMNGKLVASFHLELIGATELCLKQSLVPHTFFPRIEGYVVNAWPFI